jgi:hypothetical protein
MNNPFLFFKFLSLSALLYCSSSRSSVFSSDSQVQDWENSDETVTAGIYNDFALDFYSDEHEVTEPMQLPSALRFKPALLLYTDCPISIASISTFSIENTLTVDVHILSISADNSQFHPVMFQSHLLLRGTSLTVQLLFLPYYVETTMSKLSIMTSEGLYIYQVEGRSIPNPYRLRPFTGNRVPAGAPPFDQPIFIYNPYREPLHIRDVFTTEDFLSLKGAAYSSAAAAEASSSMREGGGAHGRAATSQSSVSTGGAAASTDLSWAVQPGTEREIIVLSLSAANMSPGFYSGYVHIKTDRDNIVLPVEMHVVEGGVYPAVEQLNFGVLTTLHEKKRLQLAVFNSWSSSITVLDVVAANTDPQLQILLNRDNLVIPPGNTVETVIGVVEYTALSAGRVDNNKLLIITDNPNAAVAVIEVSYLATVLHGAVGYDQERLVFTIPIINMSAVSYAVSTYETDIGAPAASGADSIFLSGVVEATGRVYTVVRRELELSELRTVSHALEVPETVNRTIVFTNHFSISVVLQAITMDPQCASVFVDSSFIFASKISVPSLQQWDPVTLRFNSRYVAEQDETFLPKTCFLDLWTDVSPTPFRAHLHIMRSIIQLEHMDAVSVSCFISILMISC